MTFIFCSSVCAECEAPILFDFVFAVILNVSSVIVILRTKKKRDRMALS